MAFYSMHEGAGLASERPVSNASGGLIGQHCGTMLAKTNLFNKITSLEHEFDTISLSRPGSIGMTE